MKPKDPVWNMFTIYEMNGKNVAICKDCNSSVSANPAGTRRLNNV